MSDKVTPLPNRLVSLDVFRGLTIVAMILVNTVESEQYSQLNHAAWNGWTFADTIFPAFLWIMGVALVFSLRKRLAKGIDKKTLFFQVLRRSIILFVVGILLYSFPYYDLQTIRIPGILQRIAVCYLMASAIFLQTKIRGQLLWTIGLLVLYWAILKFIPVPNFGPGILDKDGNIVQYIDVLLFKDHLYSPTFDPEGILSTISAIASTLFGILAGQLLASNYTRTKKFTMLLLGGLVMVIVGSIMNIWLPINKNLWTSSYAVFMAGLASIIFSLVFFLVEIRGLKKWFYPFALFGLNPLTLYVLSILIDKLLMILTFHGETLWNIVLKDIFVPLGGENNAQLLFALLYIVFLFGIAYVLYKKKWLFRV